MVVNPDTQRFHCFGCDAGGDVIEWVQLRHNLDFVGALKELSGLNGVINGPPTITKNTDVKVRPGYAVPRDIIEYWHRNLEFHRRGYFYGRKFTDDTINHERWGWTGDKYAIPIWNGDPEDGGQAFQVKFRRSDELERTRLSMDGFAGEELESALAQIPKYMGMKDRGVWLYDGWKLAGASTVVVFFGELDAALFNQDFSDDPTAAACSPTGGAKSWDPEWKRYFREANLVMVVPDVGEEDQGRKFAAKVGNHAWVRLIPPDAGGKDYCDLRLIKDAEMIADIFGIGL